MNKRFAISGLFLALMLITTLVFGACGDITATPAASSSNLTAKSSLLADQSVSKGINSTIAAAFPSDTQVFVSLNTNSSSGQVDSFQKVVAYLDNIPEVKKVFDNVDLVKTLGVGSYDADVKTWIGKELGVGITDVNALVNLVGSASTLMGSTNKDKNSTPTTPSTPTATGSNSNPLQLLSSLQNLPLIIGADVTNRTNAEAFATKVLAKFGSPAKTAYNGASLYTVTGFVPLTIGVSDSKLIVATKDATVKAAFDRTSGQGLDSSSNFKKVESNLATDNLGFAYLDSKSVINAVLSNSTVQKMLNSTNNNSTSAVNFPQYTDSMGMTFSTTQNGLLVDSYSIISANAPADIKAKLSRAANPSNILKALPDSTFGFANGQDAAESYNSFIGSVKSMGSQAQPVLDAISKFENQTGLSIQNDLTPLLKGESAFFVNSQSQAGHPKDLPVGIGLVSAITDKTTAQTSLDKIVNAIEKASASNNSSSPLKFENRTTNGVTYKSAGIPNTSSTYLSLGIAGNYIFLSVDNQAASPVLSATTGGSNFTNGSNAANFTTTKQSLVSDNQGFFYLDVQQALGLINALPAQEQSKVKVYTDKLTQIKAIGAASHYSSTETSSSIFLYFPVTK